MPSFDPVFNMGVEFFSGYINPFLLTFMNPVVDRAVAHR